MGNVRDKALFNPPKRRRSEIDFKDFINLTNDESNISTYFYFINQDSDYTIIFSHGNAEDLLSVKEWFLEIFIKLVPGVNIALYEYSGKFLNKIKEKIINKNCRSIYFLIEFHLNLKH